jgi:cytidylate kinase
MPNEQQTEAERSASSAIPTSAVTPDTIHQAPEIKKSKGTETRVLPETAWVTEEMPDGIPPAGTAVITISRQFGSGGSDIARLVAQWANIKYVDQEIIAEVAKRLGIDMQEAAEQDEHGSGMAGHIIEALQASNPFSLQYRLSSMRTQQHSKDLAQLQLTQRIILETASEGNTVIVGRGSQFLLHNNPRTLHIHIFAPLPDRVEHIMQQRQLTRNAARQLIEQHDYEQNTYLRRYYGSDGNQPSLYHLLINTGLFTFEHAADFICQALPAVREMT